MCLSSTINSRLKDLVLVVGRAIADSGWKAFSTVRCNLNSALAKLDLSGNTVTEHTMLSFAEALTPNKKTKELVLGSITNARGRGGAGNNIRSDGCVAFTCIFCNSSSITDTHQSNHTLEKLSSGFRHQLLYNHESNVGVLPEDLTRLLWLNRNNEESRAARFKIIMKHFRGSEVNVQVCMDMGLRVPPPDIAWVALDDSLYQFLRAMPVALKIPTQCVGWKYDK